jgi:hypothetical protein
VTGVLLMVPVHRNPGPPPDLPPAGGGILPPPAGAGWGGGVPPHLTPSPRLSGKWGVVTGVLPRGCRSPQSRPPSRPPPAGGRNGKIIPPLGGGMDRTELLIRYLKHQNAPAPTRHSPLVRARGRGAGGEGVPSRPTAPRLNDRHRQH